jgi:spore coat protein U-like protein
MKLSFVLVALYLAAFSKPAAALCDGTACTCTVSVGGNVAFGNYNPLPGTSWDATGSFTVSCSPIVGTVTYTAALSTGSGNSYSPRQMKAGAHALKYNLYTDSARTVVWGDGTGGTQTQGATSPLGPSYSQSYNVYGRIQANQQSTSIGSYSDSITITVTYN